MAFGSTLCAATFNLEANSLDNTYGTADLLYPVKKVCVALQWHADLQRAQVHNLDLIIEVTFAG
jgi:hypothetical protein